MIPLVCIFNLFFGSILTPWHKIFDIGTALSISDLKENFTQASQTNITNYSLGVLTFQKPFNANTPVGLHDLSAFKNARIDTQVCVFSNGSSNFLK